MVEQQVLLKMKGLRGNLRVAEAWRFAMCG